jgi:hypothetical protein
MNVCCEQNVHRTGRRAFSLGLGLGWTDHGILACHAFVDHNCNLQFDAITIRDVWYVASKESSLPDRSFQDIALLSHRTRMSKGVTPLLYNRDASVREISNDTHKHLSELPAWIELQQRHQHSTYASTKRFKTTAYHSAMAKSWLPKVKVAGEPQTERRNNIYIT